MNDLTNEQAAIRDLTREFVRKEIAPFAAGWDRTGTVPLDTVRQAGALGLFGICVPAEWGGSGADFLSYILMTEELAYGDAGVCNMISATNAFAWKLRDFGRRSQRSALRPVATARHRLPHVHRAQAGSDAATSRRAPSAARPLHRQRHQVVITSAARRAWACCWPSPIGGRQARHLGFLVRTDQPGIAWSAMEDKLGHRTTTPARRARGPRGPGRRHAGRRGRGQARAGLPRHRPHRRRRAVGRRGAGGVRRRPALRRERETFGKKLIEHQAIAFTLAEMATELRRPQLCLRAASLKQAACVASRNRRCPSCSTLADVERVCSAAIQITAGYGFVSDYPWRSSIATRACSRSTTAPTRRQKI